MVPRKMAGQRLKFITQDRSSKPLFPLDGLHALTRSGLEVLVKEASSQNFHQVSICASPRCDAARVFSISVASVHEHCFTEDAVGGSREPFLQLRFQSRNRFSACFFTFSSAENRPQSNFFSRISSSYFHTGPMLRGVLGKCGRLRNGNHVTSSPGFCLGPVRESWRLAKMNYFVACFLPMRT
jgi:hypothetical protein